MIISIDTGNYHLRGKTRVDDVGIAVLDTYQLSLKDHMSEPELSDLITCQYFVLDHRPVPNSKHITQYLFGKAEHVTHMNLRNVTSAILNPILPCVRRLNVFIVGHNIYADARTIRDLLGLDITNQPSVLLIIDTYDLARDICGFDRPCLGSVLRAFALESFSKHNSGNDALYTLQSLLLLFRFYKEQAMTQASFERLSEVVIPDGIESERDLLWECRLDLLTRLARSSKKRRFPRFERNAKRAFTRRGPKVLVEEPDFLNAHSSDDSVMSLLEEYPAGLLGIRAVTCNIGEDH